MRTISSQELSKHTEKGDCWVAVHGRVYNVTEWLDDHPGGIEVILDVAGRDGSRDFDEVGHSDYALNLSKKYYVGDLEGASVTQPKKEPELWQTNKVTNAGAQGSSGNASDDAGAYLVALGAASAAIGLAIYLIRS